MLGPSAFIANPVDNIIPFSKGKEELPLRKYPQLLSEIFDIPSGFPCAISSSAKLHPPLIKTLLSNSSGVKLVSGSDGLLTMIDCAFEIFIVRKKAPKIN